MNTRTITEILSPIRLFWVFGMAILSLVVLYFLMVNLAIFHTAEREALILESRSLANDISELEFVYLDSESKITPLLAIEQGYQNVERSTVFVFADEVPLGALAQNDR